MKYGKNMSIVLIRQIFFLVNFHFKRFSPHSKSLSNPFFLLIIFFFPLQNGVFQFQLNICFFIFRSFESKCQ